MLGGERDPFVQMREGVAMGGMEKLELRNWGVREASRVKYLQMIAPSIRNCGEDAMSLPNHWQGPSGVAIGWDRVV